MASKILFMVFALVAIASIQARSAKKDLLPDKCGTSLEEGNNRGKYPWTALLQYRTKEGDLIYACHASLISKRYLVTSGHCLHDDVLANTGLLVNVVLGEHDVTDDSDDQIVVPVESYVHHPKLSMKSNSRTYDIGVVRMTRDVEFTKYISPVCLPKSEATWKSKETMLHVAGWGISVETGKDVTVMRSMEVPFVDTPTCQEAFSKFTETLHLEDGQICAGGNKGNDLCQGVGGGPLMDHSKHYDLVGVFNLGGSLCGTEEVPAVYTKVFAYKDWILDQLVD